MRRIVIVVLVALALAAGCQRQEPGTSELAADLAKVTAERDQARAQLAEAQRLIDDLEGSAVEDLNGCRGTLGAVVQRMNNARDLLDKGQVEDKGGDFGAKGYLDWAGEGINDALKGDCAPAA